MSYKIDFTDIPNNPAGITVEDQSLNTERSISFVGKNYTGYAKVIAESFLHLLENFASATQPSNPVIGQLWYDTNSNALQNAQPQLKVYDGITWQPAGNVKRKSSQPLTAESVIGDLWVDTTNQQLYLWSGSSWILVGPQFSEGTLTGPKVESIIDTLLIENFVISFYVSDIRVAVISTTEFIPKLTIEGFAKIKKGVNLRDTDDNGVTSTNSLFRINGSATNSEKLGGISFTNFLRTDINSVTNGTLSVRNNGGLIIGSDLSASLTNNTDGSTVLYNKTEGSRIFIRTNQDGEAKNVITITGTNVGINKTNPVYELDVTGTIRASENLFITGTNDAVDINTGSIRTAGGLSVQKSIHVGSGMTIGGTTNTNSIVPTFASTFDIGTNNLPFKTITAVNVKATGIVADSFTGQFVGNVTGSATRLASATIMKLAGEVTSAPINFNGLQPNGEATFNTTVSPDFISLKPLINNVNADDLLLVQRPATGLNKITAQGLFRKAGILPVGTILPFAGTVIPDGFVLCDGSEYTTTELNDLFKVIGYTYKSLGLLQGNNTFAVPDLRGRFPLGLDNMFSSHQVPDKNNPNTLIFTATSQANRVNDIAAKQIGSSNGQEDIILDISQLPEHQHDMRAKTSSGAKSQQYYAIRNSSDPAGDANSVSHTTKGPTALNECQFLPNSGGVDFPITDAPVNLMNPYLSINYIIFTGKFI